MEELAPSRYRNFMVIIYPDSESYNFDDVIFNLKGFKYWAYIEHKPESDEKKIHYHAYISLDSATTEKAVAKRLGIPDIHVQFIRNCRSGMRYLTHIDYPEKIQYSLDQVHVSGIFSRKFLKAYEDVKTEEEIISDIYFWLDNTHFETYIEKVKYLILFINSNCYDSVYKRYRPEFLDYLKMNL